MEAREYNLNETMTQQKQIFKNIKKEIKRRKVMMKNISKTILITLKEFMTKDFSNYIIK